MDCGPFFIKPRAVGMHFYRGAV
jgi:transposase